MNATRRKQARAAAEARWQAALAAGTVPPNVDVDGNGMIEPADLAAVVTPRRAQAGPT